MDFRFVAYNPQTGQRLYQLPRANSVQIGDTFGTRGTLELKYSAKAVNAIDLPTFLEVQAEVTFDGGHTWAEVGPSLLRLSGEHEDTDASGMRTLRFVGREWVLDKARVGAGDGELVDGKRAFYRATPGQIIRTLILEAQDRGAAHGIDLGGFTETKDAAGNAWSKSATIYYSPGLPIGSVLENLVEQGLCDYRLDGRTLNLYEPEAAMGRDLTDRDNPVRVHGAVTEAPVKYSLEDLASAALLIGDEGFELEVENPSAPDDYGRLEVTIEQGGVSDAGTARLMVDEALQRGSREIREITRSQSAAGASFLPYRDYRVGDYVQVLEDGQWQKYRVRELQLARDGQEWTIHTVINDRLQELLLKLAKRTSGIVNGSKGSGGDGTRPTPPESPGIEPAAPEGLVIDQQVYLDRQGIARGQITAGWGAVTESTKGQAVEIGGYELWTRRNETHASWVRAASTDGDLTATHSPVVLSDADGNALGYQWRVRAIAQASNRPGPWSDTVTLTMTQDTEPPNVPSLPTVATDLRIITVDWDGLDESAEAMPVDFNHLRIYFAAAEDMAGAERVGSLTQRGTWTSGSMPADVPVWVAVSAVDHVGNESAMTPAQSVTPKKLVDDDSIRDAVDGIDGKIDDAVDDLNEAIDNIVIDDAGIATYWMPTEPDETTDPAPREGFLWFDTSEAGANELHRYVSGEWVSAADQRIDTIRNAQDSIEADVDRVRTSVDGKNAITQSTSTPPNQYDGAVGDIWEIMSSMGSGGRSVSRWRWNGTVWVSNLIGDTVLGNVDAAKIGTGYLDADRIEAGAISTDKLLVGVPDQLIENGGFEYGQEPWTHFGSAYEVVHSGSRSGARCLRYSGSGRVLGPVSNLVPNRRRDTFRASVWAKADGDANAELSFYWYAEDGSYILNRNYSFTISSEWTLLEAAYAPPEGQKIAVRLTGDTKPGAVVYFDDVEMYRSSDSTLIANGAITTEKIAVGAITAESGVIESLDAGTITVGEMDGARIKAQSIAADRVLIGSGSELMPDEYGLSNTPWYENFDGGAGTGWSAEAAYPGQSRGVVLTHKPAGTSNMSLYANTLLPEAQIPVQPGESYQIFTWVYATGPVSGFDGVHMRVYGYSDGVYKTNTLAGSALATFPSGEWVKVGGVWTAPAGINKFSPRLTVYYPAGASTNSAKFYLGRVSAKRQVGSTLIQDGAITTDKILANAITAGKIAALAIEADHISANAITADKIKAGAIDGKLITGARIRTAASGSRVELNAEGMKAYKANGSVALTTDTADGSIDMTGQLSQTIGGTTIQVGYNYNGGPGIGWEDSNNWFYPPGVRYGDSQAISGKKDTLLQGPGASDGATGLSLRERGDGFNLRSWKGTGSSLKDWRVNASLTGNYMRVGSSTSDAPYLYMDRSSSGGSATLISGDVAWFKATENNVYAQANSDGGGGVFMRRGPGGVGADHGYISISSEGIYINPQGSRKLYLYAGGAMYIPSLPSDSDAAPLGRVSGQVHSIYSSRQYKILEEPIESTVESFEDKVLSVDAKTWIDKTRAERVAAYETAVANGEEPEDDLDGCGPLERIPGVVAEDLDEAGLGVFVRYDDDGQPQSVRYDRIGPALIPIIRRLRDRVDALEQQLGATA